LTSTFHCTHKIYVKLYPTISFQITNVMNRKTYATRCWQNMCKKRNSYFYLKINLILFTSGPIKKVFISLFNFRCDGMSFRKGDIVISKNNIHGPQSDNICAESCRMLGWRGTIPQSFLVLSSELESQPSVFNFSRFSN